MGILVLIETLWNVKSSVLTPIRSGKAVLIETLWNVKLVKYIIGNVAPRINRNIVECKVRFCCRTNKACSCINRNSVECKDRTRQPHKQALFVLIETLWNVKVSMDSIW